MQARAKAIRRSNLIEQIQFSEITLASAEIALANLEDQNNQEENEE